MLPIRFEDITPGDIQRLIQDKVSEHKTLEYKQRLSIGTGDEKAEFLADISSFANASGGDIIFGISDERDENGMATGIPADIVPLVAGNAANECARIEQLIETGVQPKIPVVHVKAVAIPEHGLVIVVRVGKAGSLPIWSPMQIEAGSIRATAVPARYNLMSSKSEQPSPYSGVWANVFALGRQTEYRLP